MAPVLLSWPASGSRETNYHSILCHVVYEKVFAVVAWLMPFMGLEIYHEVTPAEERSDQMGREAEGSTGDFSGGDAYLRDLLVTYPLREAILRSAIEALRLPPGSAGLDAGCGVGLPALVLAEAVGPGGHVTGLDVRQEFVPYATTIAERASLSDRVSFRKGDVSRLPFDDDVFDWAWSVDCVGYAPMEPLALVKELVRVVRPGGTVAIMAWSSEQLLPGYPLLEARLRATSAGIAPFVKGQKPERHLLRALGWFREAGLEQWITRTLAGGAHAPLSDAPRKALVALFEMRWPGVESELAQADLAEYERLCLPESPDFIVNHPDYYAFFTYSMFSGKVAEETSENGPAK
jgi:demethylmenaquinone methyltransferase/2-methoxy-6-polyprenyl-1,4-benzoquinol methylase